MAWACVPADKHLAGLVILSVWGRSRFGVPRVGMLFFGGSEGDLHLRARRFLGEIGVGPVAGRVFALPACYDWGLRCELILACLSPEFKITALCKTPPRNIQVYKVRDATVC